MYRLGATVIALWMASGPGALDAAPRRADIPRESTSMVSLFEDAFDIEKRDEIDRLHRFVRELLTESDQMETSRKEKERMRGADDHLHELSPEELKEHFRHPDDAITRKDRRGLYAMDARLSRLREPQGVRDAGQLAAEIRELAAAVMNNRRSPIPDIGPGSTWMALDNLDNSPGTGGEEAINLAECAEAGCRCAPPNSTFWTRPESIATRDLKSGFGRTSAPDWSSRLWSYHQPKTSRGANPGFEVRSGDFKAKIKFAEVFSEPFTARVFHALGYNVDATDHVSAIKVKYDRRIFREFNLRRPLSMRVRPFGFFTLFSVDMQAWHDPFDYFEGVVLKTGERLNRQQFRERLVLRPAMERRGLEPGEFDEAFEVQIDHLVTVPVNFQIDDPEAKSVGPWGFGQLGHHHLRELRAVALLAAWLGWFDTRMDNTRLRIKDGGLKHFFSDLGGGLGKSEAAFNWKSESPNDFPWEFTRAPIVRGKGRMTTPFRIIHFHTILDNEAFQSMTTADAVWIGRMIGQLTREQIVEGLAASGYDEAETLFYAEKLVHRRNRMVRDLGLDEEFPDLPRQFDQLDFDHDPRAGTHRVVGGQLVSKNVGSPQLVAE